jgi:hypothetical protein
VLDFWLPVSGCYAWSPGRSCLGRSSKQTWPNAVASAHANRSGPKKNQQTDRCLLKNTILALNKIIFIRFDWIYIKYYKYLCFFALLIKKLSALISIFSERTIHITLQYPTSRPVTLWPNLISVRETRDWWDNQRRQLQLCTSGGSRNRSRGLNNKGQYTRVYLVLAAARQKCETQC